MWLLTIGTVVVSASSLQVESRERLLHPDVALTDELQGSIAAALQTIADDQKLVDSDRAVFMQDGMTITKTNSTKVQSDVTRHSAWELVAEDLVQKRFGNSSAAKGLEALLGEARAAEVSMTDWQQLALAIAALTPKNVLGQKEAGPSHAFPARHVVRPSTQTPKAKQRYESYEAMDDQWNEWTVICILGLIGIMLTSFVTANKRSQPGKMSRMLELETRWKLTGSSTAGHLSLLRQAAQAAQAPPPSSSTQDLSVWDATVNLFSCLVGTGLLAMPYAFSLAGLIAAPLVLVFVTCSAYTAHLMVWAMQAEESRRGVPSGRLAIGLDWSGLAHAAFGPKAKKLVELFLIVELWGYLLSTVVCASLNITQLGIATNPAVALSVTGAFALTFVPVKLLTKVNVLSNLVYIASALMFVATGILLPQKAPPSEIQTVKPHGLLAAAGILIFSPAGHSFYPRLIQQMEEPSKFPSCIKRAYSGACVVYLLIAVPGYLLFGDAAQPSAVRNIGLDRALVPLPDLWWMNTLAALGLVVKLIPNQALVLSPLSAVIKGALRSRAGDLADTVQLSVTPMVLLVTALVSVHFANEMAYLLNLLGSFFCMNIAFVLPVLCYWRLTCEVLSPARQLFFASLVAMGVAGAVLGVVSCF